MTLLSDSGALDSGPIPQCSDTDIVVFGQGDKLGIFRHEEIDYRAFIRKSLSNMTGFVIHSFFNKYRLWIDICG